MTDWPVVPGALPVAPEVVDAGPAPQLNCVIYPIHRLRICALLEPVTEEEFSVIRDLVGVSDSVLSKHVSALREAGFVSQRGGAQWPATGISQPHPGRLECLLPTRCRPA
jgi:DNA-binding transcriptional ArsR family regulator